MFGYVVIDKPNILIKDYQTYRGYYCGLCKAIGKHTGQAMRLTLNYDIVLLALLAHNYENTEPEFVKGKCLVHPLGKGINYVKSNSILERIADINTILGYYKVCDDVIDEGKHRTVKSLLKPYFNKAKKRMPDLARSVEERYEKLRELEKQGADENALAECFGTLMMSVADSLTDKSDKNLREFSFYLGKWVYVIDAFDDLKQDFGEKNYNPLLKNVTELSETVYNEIETRAHRITNEAIDKIISAYELMDIKISEGALSNIIYKGLDSRTEFVINKRGEKCRKIRL